MMENTTRRRASSVATIVSALALGAGAGAVGAQWNQQHYTAAPQFFPSVHASTESVVGTGSYAPIVKRVSPAVVNIATSKTVKVSQRGEDGMRGLEQLPPELRQFFGGGSGGNGGNGHNFFGSPSQPRRPHAEHSLGSGVIVDPRGYILTNNHVVEGATEVTVSLSDRREFKAKVIGNDSQTDVAVLKIDAANLPTLPLADSSKVQVGDVALAVGNPFGVGQTVTMGIVGATGRSGLGIEDYEDFIQTDAAINPGNSGGALVNTRGELIAINTAILAGQSGGNQGIGFAIPINMAAEVMNQLVKNGKVTRGFVGVNIQPVTPAIARSFHLADRTDGVVVTNVEAGTPGSKAGLQTGDVVTAVNGTPIIDANQFRLQVSRLSPGSVANLKLFRDGQEKTVAVTLGAFPENKLARNVEQGGEDAQKESALEGVSVEPVTPQVARQLGLSSKASGLIVTDVDDSSAAATAGLREQDIIEQVNRKPVTSVGDLRSAMKQSSDKSVLLLVRRGEGQFFVAIEPKKG